MANKVGVAVFGLGRMGLQHVKNILQTPRASLQWIVCDNVDDARRLQQEYNLNVKCTTPDNVDQALDDSSVSAVMVVSPSKTHEGLINKSLEADKAVFCEKPLTSEISSTRACYDLAEKKGKPLLCGFQRRFDPSFYSIYTNVRSGGLGQPRIIKSSSRDFPFPPVDYLRTSGGIFKDSTIHDLDLGSWIAGSRPKTVFAQGHAFNPELREFGDNDQVVAIVTYENGCISVHDNGRLCPYGYDQRLEVLCEKSMLTADNQQTNVVTSSGSKVTSEPRIQTSFIERYVEAYKNELDHFIDIIQDRCESRVTKKDTIQSMTLAELCAESLKRGEIITYKE